MKFLTQRKGGGGAEKVLAMLKGGTTSFGVWLEELTILKGGGRKTLPLFKREVKSFTLAWGGGGGGQKVLNLRFSHFVAPPPRN